MFFLISGHPCTVSYFCSSVRKRTYRAKKIYLSTASFGEFLHITGHSNPEVTVGFRGSADRNTRMPADGERPDNLGLTTDAQNSAVFGEQHRVTGGLAQLNDGLQRQRGGRNRYP
jgi:hypothetical protein